MTVHCLCGCVMTMRLVLPPGQSTTWKRNTTTMRIPDKRHLSDCIWFVFIAFALLALDNFNAKDHFIAIGGGHILAQGWAGIFSVRHLLSYLFILQYVLATYLVYTATRINGAMGGLFLLALWAMMVADMTFRDVVGKDTDLVNIALLDSAFSRIGDLVSVYIVSIVVQVGLAAILFVPLLRRLNKDVRPRRKLRWFIVPLVLMYAMYAVTFMTKGQAGLQGYPKGYAFGFGTLSVQANHAFRQMQSADPFDVKTISPAVVDRIIVVVDSAVNYADFVATGANTHPDIIDYGNAFSAANCRAASNYVLRRAGWIRNGQGEIVVKGIESWFSLARKAGYKTAYIDNANVLDDPFNKLYFDTAELSEIDFLLGGENALHTRDLVSVAMMPDLLARKNMFVLVNKVGAYFPYDKALPPNAASGRKAYNYKKVLELNTKGYLEKLIDVLDDQTVVFYTSDHGQNTTAAVPHCNTGKDIRRTEYTVPFLVMTKNAGMKKQLKAKRSSYANKLTHLEFSESIRNIMGFKVDGIDSIFKPPRHLNNIYCGLYGPPYTILDDKPQCRGLK